MGPKNLATPAHFTSSPRPTPKRKKFLRTNKEGSNCQDMLPRTILFSASRDHGRRKQHATKGSLLKHPKGKHKCSGPAIGAWWRSNSRKGCHLLIKYLHLTSWPHLCGHDPWTMLSRSPQLAERQKKLLMGCALKYRHR